MSDQDLLLSTLQNLSTAGGPGAKLGQVVAQLEHINGYLQHLEGGVARMASELQRTSLTNQMLARLLVEKNVLTEEEMNTRYKDEVYTPIKNAQEELQRQIKEQIDSQKAALVEVPNVDESSEEDDTSTEDANVVLASERFKRD